MTVTVFLVVAAVLVGLAVYGVLMAEHPLRKILALNVLGAAVFLVLIATGGRSDGPPDPVAQAMVLTGIVVAVSATALALALLLALYRHDRAIDLDRDDGEGSGDDA
ncbi:MAG: NADH-quinone oxidoreductase subunit K [Xanthomonadaceae bacterium]|nr:NADH-quinone oxidoreductase subunit K [Xanthomonadaceae bacterium]